MSRDMNVIQARAWYWQRISAMVLTVFVMVHLVVMIVAIRGGLTAAEILGRTKGSWTFGIFYGLFVLACAAHVPLGVVKISQEWGRISDSTAYMIGRIFAFIILVMGAAAVWGVVI